MVVVVVPVVVIMDATRPVAEAAIGVVIMLARRSSTGGVRLKNPASRCSRTPHRVNPSKNKFLTDAPQKRDFTTLRSPIARMR
jgi:hypothetical protein